MVIKGCRSCRRRHVKCKFGRPDSACDKCLELGQPCDVDGPIRFKQVTHVNEKVGNVRRRYDFTWDHEQVWLSLDNVTFAGEISAASPQPPTKSVEDALANVDAVDDVPMESDVWDHNVRRNLVEDVATLEETSDAPPLRSQGEWHCHVGCTAQNSPIVERGIRPSPGWSESLTTSPITQRDHHIVSPLGTNSIVSEVESIAHRSSTRMHVSLTPGQQPSWLGSATEIHTPGSGINWVSATISQRPSLQPREAVLLRYYVTKVAPLFDVCDSVSHFGTEIPRRAMHIPMIMHAILALASRVQFLLCASDELESRQYFNDCLQDLIPVLSQEEDLYDDNLLATITLLKFYEELDASTNPKSQLIGSQSLLNAVPTFCSSGGLAEAASWQLLRATIYGCMVHREPWQLHLESYEKSAVFRKSDDVSYANIIIFLVARLGRFLSDYRRSSAVDWSEWYWIQQQVSRWEKERPKWFLPLDYREINLHENRPLPELWMLSPAAVVGTQFYHTAMAFLKIHRPGHLAESAFKAAAQARKDEAAAAMHVAETVALSICHDSVENAKLGACHLVSLFGYCITHPLQRVRVQQFLQHVEDTIGWKASETAASLQEQWDELDALRDQLT